MKLSPKLAAVQRKLNDPRRGFGPGTIVVAEDALPPPPRLSTGSLAFDIALGGGLPTSQFHEWVGEESSGKTTTIQKLIAWNQRINPDFTVVWVCGEDFDAGLARQNGCDLSRILLVDTNAMEEAYQAALEYMQSMEVDLVVIDSYPALVPDAEWGKDFDERAVGVGAYVTGTFMRKSYRATRRSMVEQQRPVTIIFVNQFREKIGVMYGDPKTTGGGKAKNYRACVRLEVKRMEVLRAKGKGKQAVGQRIQIRTMKNKSAPPFQSAAVDYYFREYEGHEPGDYDLVKEVGELAVYFGLATLSGNTYTLLEEKFVGKAKITEALRERPEFLKAVWDATLELGKRSRLPDDPDAEPSDEDEDDEEDPPDYVSPAPRRRAAAAAKQEAPPAKTALKAVADPPARPRRPRRSASA